MRGKTVFLTTASVLSLFSAGMAGHAQEQTAETDGRDRITVTGSRISRPDYVSNSPIVTVDADRIERSPAVTIDEIINELPQIRGSIGAGNAFPQRGAQANINLRGLGTNRSLVLLNGRRIQPSNADGTIDVNIIPTNLVQNVETVTGGASATYGSDAMSGVVNFLLRDDFSGARLDLQYGGPTDFDSQSGTISALVGGDFADGRGNGVVSLSYARRTALQRQDRDFFEISVTNTRLPYALANLTANPPSQAGIDTLFGQYGVAPGSVSPNVRLGYNTDGTFFSSPGNAPVVNFKGYEGNFLVYNNAVVNNSGQNYDIQQPLERFNGFAAADFAITDTVEAYSQFFFTHYTAPSNGPPLSLGAGGSNGVVSVDNPFIPADMQALLATRDDPTAPFPITYLLTQIGNYVDSYKNTVYQVQAGLRGDLPVRDWSWDVYGYQGHTGISNTLYNNAHLPTFQAMLGSSDGGASICEGGFNPWAAPGDALSDECVSLLRRDPSIYSEFEQFGFEGTLEGGLADLPAGELRFALGASYRDDSFNVEPDSFLQIPGEGIGVFLTYPVDASQSVSEFFVEMLVPVLADQPFAKHLNVSAAYRYSDYSSVGGVHTYKGDIDWAPVEAVRFRGGYSRAIRAPSLGELYNPAQTRSINIGQPTATGTAGDPCDVRSSFRMGGDASQVRALCLAQGVPAAAIDTYTYVGTSVFGSQSGNPNLSEEYADTYSVGVVLQSSSSNPWFANLQASVDYYNIDIKDAVGTLPFSTGLVRCFNADGSNPTYDPNNVNCSILNRDASTGRINNGMIATLNLANYATDGIDVAVDWRLELADTVGGSSGALNISSVLNYLNSFELQTLPGTPALDYAGYSESPLSTANIPNVLSHWKAVTSAAYENGGLEAGVRWRYMSGVDDVSRLTTPDSDIPGVSAYNYIDLFASYAFNDNVKIAAGVDNVMDKEPPQIGLSPGTTDYNNYDVIGRTFFVRLTAQAF